MEPVAGISRFLGRKEGWMIRPLRRTECHVFTHNGTRILFHVDGGNFFEVDDVTEAILERTDGHTLLDLLDLLRERFTEKDVVSAFKELREEGVILDTPPEPVHPFSPPGRLEVVHLALDVTYDTLGGPDVYPRDSGRTGQEYMTEDVACRAIDLLMAESGRVRKCHITFQGGEPLLNAPLVDRAITYAKARALKAGKHVVFEVTTDNRLLNEQVFGLLRRHGAEVVVKLNETRDGELPMFNAHGAYSLSAADVADYARRKDVGVHINGDVHRGNLNVRERVEQTMAAYPNARSVSLKFRPDCRNPDNAVTGRHLTWACAAIEDLADYVRGHILDRRQAWIGDFEDCLEQVYNGREVHYHCGAGTRYLTVTPDGGLYVCPGLVRREEFKVGDVFSGIDRERQRSWIKSTYVEKFAHCSDCWSRFLCGGGCRLGSFLENSRVDEPDEVACQIIRRTYELAMGTCLEIASADGEALAQRYAEAG